eukprot:gene14138-biopygen2750
MDYNSPAEQLYLRCNIVFHDRDAKYLAHQLALQEKAPGFLNPSDSQALMFGCLVLDGGYTANPFVGKSRRASRARSPGRGDLEGGLGTRIPIPGREISEGQPLIFVSGLYWECGRGLNYVGEEDWAATSTGTLGAYSVARAALGLDTVVFQLQNGHMLHVSKVDGAVGVVCIESKDDSVMSSSVIMQEGPYRSFKISGRHLSFNKSSEEEKGEDEEKKGEEEKA